MIEKIEPKNTEDLENYLEILTMEEIIINKINEIIDTVNKIWREDEDEQ